MTFNFWEKTKQKLIDKQFKKQQYSIKKANNNQTFQPCITVSRETGSGGRLIAALVAKKLKMKLYDKEFVELIGQSTKKRQEVVESLDEKNRGMIEGIIESLSLSDNNKLSESRYFKHLCQTILSLAQKNKSVILGRGANFILPPQYCLNIRIIAPLKTRIDNTIKYEKKTLKQAKDDIRKIHDQRKEFIKKYFQKNISNANYYDLVINTQFISLEQVISLIVTAFKKRFPKINK